MDHPQRFQIVGRRVADVEVGAPPDLEGATIDHLPPGPGWIYRVIGPGLDYLGCRTCFPDGTVTDNRRTTQ